MDRLTARSQPPRERDKAWKAKSIGAALGTIMAIIMTNHIAKHSQTSAAPHRSIGISHMNAVWPPAPRIASIASARSARYSHDSSVSARSPAPMIVRWLRNNRTTTLGGGWLSFKAVNRSDAGEKNPSG